MFDKVTLRVLVAQKLKILYLIACFALVFFASINKQKKQVKCK
jgi:hypothetical protein